GCPQIAGTVEKILEWRRHVAEAGRTAQRQTGTSGQIVMVGIRRSLGRYCVFACFTDSRYRRDCANARTDSLNGFNAPSNMLCHLGGIAETAVIEHKYLGHGGSPMPLSADYIEHLLGRAANSRTVAGDDDRPFNQDRMRDH